MNNLSSYCVLTDSRMRPSDKDLPVCRSDQNTTFLHEMIVYLLVLDDPVQRTRKEIFG